MKYYQTNKKDRCTTNLDIMDHKVLEETVGDITHMVLDLMDLVVFLDLMILASEALETYSRQHLEEAQEGKVDHEKVLI